MFDITQIKTTFTSANGTAIPYSELIDGIQCTVVHFIKTGLISWDDADDAVMDAVEKACRYTGRFDEKRTSAWKFGAMIARSRTLATFSGNRIQTVSMDECPAGRFEETLWGTYRGNEYNADRAVLENETYEALDKAVSRLGEREQRIVGMAAEEFKPSEIAKELGLSSNVVSTSLCRSRKALRPRMAAYLCCSGPEKVRSNSFYKLLNISLIYLYLAEFYRQVL